MPKRAGQAGRGPGRPPGRPLAGADLDRRRFFRQFATDVFHTAATVVGAATALQRSSAEAASAILNGPARRRRRRRHGGPRRRAVERGSLAPSLGRGRPPPTGSAFGAGRPPASATTAPSASRATGSSSSTSAVCPFALVEVDCRTAIEVANEIGDRTIMGGRGHRAGRSARPGPVGAPAAHVPAVRASRDPARGRDHAHRRAAHVAASCGRPWSG